MPHKCTACGRVFADGSEDVLSGCPDCDGNTFQYLRSAPADDGDGTDEPARGPVRHVTTTLKDFISDGGEPLPEDERPPRNPAVDPEGDDSHSREDSEVDDGAPESDTGDEREAIIIRGESDEHHAQSSARTDVVSREELPDDVADLVRVDPSGDGVIIDGEPVEGGALIRENPDGDASDGAAEAESSDGTVEAESPAETGDSEPPAETTEPESPAEPSESGVQDEPEPTGSTVEAEAEPTEPGVDETPDESGTPEPDQAGPAPATAGGAAAETDRSGATATTDRPAGAGGEDRLVATDPDEVLEELDDQFEGIRVHRPGLYELNPVELFDREETVIALKEDGRYVIDVPDSWLEA